MAGVCDDNLVDEFSFAFVIPLLFVFFLEALLFSIGSLFVSFWCSRYGVEICQCLVMFFWVFERLFCNKIMEMPSDGSNGYVHG